MARSRSAQVKRTAKHWLRRGGLEVARAGRGPRRSLEDVLAQARKLGVAPATVVDVGVAAGTPELYEAFPEAELLLIEPMQEWRAQLEAMSRPARVHVEIAAAGPSAGELTLHVHRVPACSSVLGARAWDGEQPRARSVPVAAIDTLVELHGFKAPYLVKVDVEGAELDVLAGATRTLERTDLLLLEVSLFQLVPSGPQFGEVVCALRELGWSVYDIYNGHLRPLDGALAQVDLAFAHDDGPLRARHDYATPEQADRLYRSWGH
ncbi:MAG: hypothetical protein QOI03_1440 [Solirubrobacteraceae bacterium]|jgi:FkbM family methyltransferase|nr:hypothetical protein [Solirubrobacteraceae bacterium]